MLNITQMGINAKEAAYRLSVVSAERKNAFLFKLAELLEKQIPAVLEANTADVADARESLSPAMVDRLTLTESRILGIVQDVRNVANLPDPVGEVFEEFDNADGLHVYKKRVPIGVIAVIYESRPNVTIDSACLMVKSGNAAILRGGKEAIRTNRALLSPVYEALEAAALPKHAIQFVDSPDRALMNELLQLDESIDLLIPRGGAGLHEFCRRNSRIPVITGGIGVCHLFVDRSALPEKSVQVIRNAKVQRPTVCNALETLLVHQAVAETFIPQVCAALAADGVRFKADEQALTILSAADLPGVNFEAAGEGDFDVEWLSLVLGIRVVDGLTDAVAHIRRHGTLHSDGILTEDAENAKAFVASVNSACVYVNASTRFTDGAQLGLGAEIAVSTQPLHARGPMALRELTTYQWVIQGDYHSRK